MDAELVEIVAAVGELFGQGMLVHVGPVGAEQLLGAGDQGIEMQFALLLGLVVGAVGWRQAGRAGASRHQRDARTWRHAPPSSARHVAHVARPDRRWAEMAR